MACRILDQDEAGSVWRSQKLQDFGWRAQVLGCSADAEIQHLLRELQHQTQELEGLRSSQAVPGYHRPWWADGEYDSARADRSNDAGLQSLAAGKLSEAFDHLSNAIRLCPSTAVYHGNRAAVALRLKQPSIALQDAREATIRDVQYMKGYFRAGIACLQLAKHEEAVNEYQKALAIEPQNAAAKAGLRKAMEAAESLQKHSAAAAPAGMSVARRPGLPRKAAAHEDAALQLECARAMLDANPDLEAARCAFVEATIMCGRYAAARETAGELLSSWPTVAGEALEDGRYQDAIEACEEARGMLDERACTGLVASLLSQQAAAHMGRSQHAPALANLQHALALQPGRIPTLLLRAQAYRCLGRVEDSYLDLQEVSQACPDHPGILDLLQQAAQLCLTRQARLTGDGAWQGIRPHQLDNHYITMGLELDCSEQQIKQAYRRLAGRWHPDKWAARPEVEQQHAKGVFDNIKHASDILLNPEDRARYDASLFC
ncbi:hypothetical protein WJX84_009725 [Apatococcus fuscideae]|uniref:J domain-containing protein n=1 Tax=Apatococcus fuscideae TaxID=2026836 RepID=A0AAW1T9K3_9CHLO